MSTPEDRLRDVLRSSADEVVPAGDGLSRIQARLARRRRLRWTLLPGAALVAAGATVAVLALGGTDPRTTDTLRPGETPGPATPTASTAPTTPAVKGVYSGPLLSSYTSADKDDVVRHWLGEVGIQARPLAHECESCDVVPIGVGDAFVGEAALVTAHVVDGVRHYALVSVTNDQLTITSPAAGGAVATSFEVRGTVVGYHQSISLALLTPEQLGTAQAMAGQDQPWSATLTWQHREWSTASLVARTYSDKDGSLDKLVALPVTQADQAPSPSYAVLRDGHVERVTGDARKQLTFPPAGATDTALAYAADRLVWVRSRGECDADLLQLVDGTPTTLKAKTAGLRTPRLSPSGRTVAWVAQDCGDGPDQVHVQVGEARERVLAAGPEGKAVSLLDVTDDGALLVRLTSADDPTGSFLYVPAVADLTEGKELAPASSCTHHGAGTFTGSTPGLWEECDGRSRYVSYSVSGARGQAGPLVDATDVRAAAERGGVQLLLVGNREGGADVATYADPALTYQTHCGSTDCTTAADW